MSDIVESQKSAVDWLGDLFVDAHVGEPLNQMKSSAIIAMVAYLSSAVGLVVTAIIGMWFTFLFLVGLTRIVYRAVRG